MSINKLYSAAMSGTRLTIAEKTVKIAIGVGKLAATGGLSLDTAKTVIDILKDGESLKAKFTSDEKKLAAAIERTVEQRIAEAEANPEIARGTAHDLRARFDQALDHSIPDAETLRDAALDAALEADRTAWQVIGLMHLQIMSRAPEALRPYYADPNSADSRFFAAVLFSALQPLFADDAYLDGLGRAISGRMLADLGGLKQAAADLKAGQEAGFADLGAQLAEMKALLAARPGATGSDLRALEAEIAPLEAEKSENAARIVNLLRLLLDRDIPPERWAQSLAEAETRARALLDGDAYRLPNEAGEDEREAVAAARAALALRDFATAEAHLRRARDLGRARRRDAVEMLAAQDAAETAAIAETRKAALDYRGAAALYA
jgi:hypothetical protein